MESSFFRYIVLCDSAIILQFFSTIDEFLVVNLYEIDFLQLLLNFQDGAGWCIIDFFFSLRQLDLNVHVMCDDIVYDEVMVVLD